MQKKSKNLWNQVLKTVEASWGLLRAVVVVVVVVVHCTLIVQVQTCSNTTTDLKSHTSPAKGGLKVKARESAQVMVVVTQYQDSFIVSSDCSLSIAVNTKHYMSFVINNRNTVN